jgi:DNA-directed RNA polymerase subunit RPC12/RpoP
MFGKSAWNLGLEWSDEVVDKFKKSWENREKVKCPHCNKIGHQNGMTHYHFDNCKENPMYVLKLELLVCPHCGFKSTSRVCMKRWHFDNCKNKMNNSENKL